MSHKHNSQEEPKPDVGEFLRLYAQRYGIEKKGPEARPSPGDKKEADLIAQVRRNGFTILGTHRALSPNPEPSRSPEWLASTQFSAYKNASLWLGTRQDTCRAIMEKNRARDTAEEQSAFYLHALEYMMIIVLRRGVPITQESTYQNIRDLPDFLLIDELLPAFIEREYPAIIDDWLKEKIIHPSA